MLMTACRTETETVGRMQKAEPFDCCCSGVTVSLLVSALTVDILSTFCGVFTVQCVKLMLRIFVFGVLLSDCFVYRQNLTCLNLKRFTMYGHYAGEVEDIF